MKNSHSRNLMSHDIRELLLKNGLDAEIILDTGGNPVLNIRGNRGAATSPPCSYKLNKQQLDILINTRYEGTGTRMRKAYNTINTIISKDFYAPQNYVVAKEAGLSRSGEHNRLTAVNMGWNGVNERIGRHPYAPNVRMQERCDGSLRPGEAAAMRRLPNGMYVPTAGYVWKGSSQEVQQVAQQEQPEIKVELKPVEAPRPEPGQAIPLSSFVNTAGNDTYVMLKDVLESHGIVIKEGKDEKGETEKQLIVMAKDAKVNITYHLSEEEYQKLTADGWMTGENALQSRLDIINGIIKQDFKEPITKDMLNMKNYVNLSYQDGRREVIEAKYVAYENQMMQRQQQQAQLKELQAAIHQERERIFNDPKATDGRDISSVIEGKAFFHHGAHGRQLVVGEIRADDLQIVDPTSKHNGETYYRLLANINGKDEEKEISQKEFNRWMNMNDAERLRMFADKFKVDIEKGHDDSWEIVQGPNGPSLAQDIRIAQSLNTSVNLGILNSLHSSTYTQKGKDNVQVSDIRVWNLNDARISDQDRETIAKAVGKDKDAKSVHHVITARIDGRTIVQEMSQKDFKRFMASDDKQRLKIADKMFDQFKIRKLPEYRANTGRTILGILGAVTGGTLAVWSAKEAMGHPHHGPHRGYEPPLMAAQHAAEVFEQITEDVTRTAEVISGGLHK